MSTFLDTLDAEIAKIATAHGAATSTDLSNLKTEMMVAITAATASITTTLSDTQAALAAAQSELATLQTALVADEGVETSLLARVTDVETGLTHVVNHLANGNATDAAAAAQTVVQAAPQPVTPTVDAPLDA